MLIIFYSYIDSRMATTKYEYAIFFDNDGTHVTAVSVCPRIKCVKVNCTEDNPETRLPENVFPPKEYKKKLSPDGKNIYDIMAPKAGEEMYDSHSGIQAAEIAILYDWINQLPQKGAAAAMFDFDRTITVMEGFDPSLSTEPGFTYKGYMNYLCGGTERCSKLIKMFAVLIENSIDIIIVTNNGSCPEPVRNLIGTLCDPAKVFIICSRRGPPTLPAEEPRDSPNRPIAKLLALMKDGRFKTACHYTGGGRKTLGSGKGPRRSRQTLRRR